MKIAVLIHLSPAYPLLVKDFLKSLKLSLGDEHQYDKALLKVGATEKEVGEEVQKLMIEEPDYLVAYTNVAKLEQIQEVASKMGQKTILIDSGAQPREKIDVAKNVHWLSFQLMDAANYLSGFLTTKTSERLAVVSDFINSGYQTVAEFVRVFEKKGGEICMQHVIPAENELENQLDALAERIIEEEPSVIYLNAHNEVGALLTTLAQRKDLIEKLPEVKWAISGQLAKELDPNKLGEGVSFYCCHTWEESGDSWSHYTQQFEAETQRNPTALAVLAYEAGLMISQLEESGEMTNIQTPRGTLTWNESVGSMVAKHHIYKISNKGNECMEGEMGYTKNEENIDIRVMSGWMNAYLCY